MKFVLRSLMPLLIMISFSLPVFGQVFQSTCNPVPFVVDTAGPDINWSQFPDFKLPFNIVYHGKAPADSCAWPLRKGFSHLAIKGTLLKDTILPSQRAYTWTGVVNADNWAVTTNQPWRMIKSPWNNDIPGYRNKWWGRLNSVGNNWYKYTPPNEPRFDLVIADIETQLKTDAQILSIKNDPLVPAAQQALSDSAFIAEYKLKMAELYAEPLILARDSLHPKVTLTSYSDVPITRTWWGIDDHTWNEWQTDSSLVSYLMHGPGGFMNSSFYNELDVAAPSIYNFYDVDSTTTGRKYLAYNLFSIEANQAWTNKPLLTYVWLNYHGCCGPKNPLKPWMAEATAVFPLMAGVQGLYPWIPTAPQGYASYEYFVYGLYRVSKLIKYFGPNAKRVIPEPAHASFINATPIWRGLVTGNRILIAAQNPYAAPGDTTLLPVGYSTWKDTIGLVGPEVFLCVLDMNFSTLSANATYAPLKNGIPEPTPIRLYPNPAKDRVAVQSDAPVHQMWLMNLQGQVQELSGFDPEQPVLDVSGLAAGMYLVQIKTDFGVESLKLKVE